MHGRIARIVQVQTVHVLVGLGLKMLVGFGFELDFDLVVEEDLVGNFEAVVDSQEEERRAVVLGVEGWRIEGERCCAVDGRRSGYEALRAKSSARRTGAVVLASDQGCDRLCCDCCSCCCCSCCYCSCCYCCSKHWVRWDFEVNFERSFGRSFDVGEIRFQYEIRCFRVHRVCDVCYCFFVVRERHVVSFFWQYIRDNSDK